MEGLFIFIIIAQNIPRCIHSEKIIMLVCLGGLNFVLVMVMV